MSKEKKVTKKMLKCFWKHNLNPITGWPTAEVKGSNYLDTTLRTMNGVAGIGLNRNNN
jgi:hypothetical protein